MITTSLPKHGGAPLLLIGLFAMVITATAPRPAGAEAIDPFIGEISCGGWNACPYGWIECNGQLLPIADFLPLYALIGTTYGGNGQTTFAVPNLAGRTMVGIGTGPGLTAKNLGATGGAETVTLTTNQLPAHTHTVLAQTAIGTGASPNGKVAAGVSAGDSRYAPSYSSNIATMGASTSAGSAQPHNNRQPYLAIKCCIATDAIGLYPSFP